MLRIFGFGMLKMLGVGVRNFTMFRALRLGGQTFSRDDKQCRNNLAVSHLISGRHVCFVHHNLCSHILRKRVSRNANEPCRPLLRSPLQRLRCSPHFN